MTHDPSHAMTHDPSHTSHNTPAGVGIGFRFSLAEALLKSTDTAAQFVEISPENYLGVGGKRARLLDMVKERFPVIAHGLCGDFAGSAPLDHELLRHLKALLKATNAKWYSDHLCLTHAAGAEIHDLVPLAMNGDTVKIVAERIRTLQDILDTPLAFENASAYTSMPGTTMTEWDFVKAVAEEADCKILLDVNNVYVNAVNFGFEADTYIDGVPLERVAEIHMAGHHVEEPGLIIDTHGAPVADPVFALLERTWAKLPQRVPVLLERDHNIPPLAELEPELRRLAGIVAAPIATEQAAARAGAPRETALDETTLGETALRGEA